MGDCDRDRGPRYWATISDTGWAIASEKLSSAGQEKSVTWKMRTFETARDLLKRHGGRTIFYSRFIFGLRTIAGPHGSLGMEWKTFLKFNVLGATTWVLAMAWAGFAFSNEFDTLLGYIEKASWAMAAGLFFRGILDLAAAEARPCPSA